jgi:rhodanese-related sulfurtransferase
MNKIIKTYLAKVTVVALAFMAFSVQAEKKLAPESIDGTTRVSAEKIFELFDEYDDLVIIDSRKPADREAGYIEGSVPLPDFDTTGASLAKHLASKSTPVVFYCNGERCGRSGNAANVAIKEGYTNIFWFRGGWEEWEKKGYPVAKD